MMAVNVAVAIIIAVVIFAVGAAFGIGLTALLSANKYDEIRSDIIDSYLEEIRENDRRMNTNKTTTQKGGKEI